MRLPDIKVSSHMELECDDSQHLTASESPGKLVKHRLLQPTLEFLIQQDWDRA